MSAPRRYAEAGVDLEARHAYARGLPAILRQARRPEVMSDAGPFSGLFRLGEGYRDPVLAASADGIGTKVKLNLALGRLDLCGFDIVGHSVDDILTCGARPLFLLDYIASDGLTSEQKSSLVQGIAQACAEAGCALLGGETADMPGTYMPGEFDVAGFIVGVVERDEVIDGKRIAEGDVLVGVPSSGMHTNGFSLIRKALDICNGESAEETVVRARERPTVLGGESIGEAILKTHRTYHNVVAPVLSHIHGIAHITGGGYIENVPRMLPETLGAVLDTSAWPVLPIFRLIEQRGEIPREEMYEVFNMGLGLVLAVAQASVSEVLAAIDGALVVGRIEARAGPPVRLLGL